jgi:Flp pilus assembly protein TadD
MALALLQFQTNDLRSAEEQLQQARALEPENPALPGLLADVYATAGRLAGARQAIEAALRLRPEEPDFLSLQADLLLASGDLGGAERAARTALAVQPGHSRSLEALARALRARGQPAAALAALEPLLDRPSTAEETLLTASQLARQLGQPDRADELKRRHARRLSQRRQVERLTYRAALSPDDPEIRLQLARVYQEAGDPARAVVELRRALALRPGWRPAQRALAAARAANAG